MATPAPRTWTIGEVAERTGLAASALRYYEREGLIPKAFRHGGKRIWRAEVLDRLAVIGVAKAAGFSMAEIRTLLSGVGRRRAPGPRWRRLAARKRAELDARIAEAERMKRVLDAVEGCACPTLDDCARGLDDPVGACRT